MHRKKAGGRRTWRGAWVLDRVMMVWQTSRKRSVKFLDARLGRVNRL